MTTRFTCPYNPAHVMKVTRAHQHVINCRKANIHLNYRICSFNALHHYPPEEEAHHLATCASRTAIADGACAYYSVGYTDKGDLSMPPPPVIQFEKEDWESDD